MFHVAFFAVVTWCCIGDSIALTCHCQDNAACNTTDGSCPAGCDKGWYGPGCQLGNLALKKPAYQSSNYLYYTADYAVNGIAPPSGDTSEWNCSHTAEATTGALWWYVVLSDTEDFVLKNITIVNRQGDNGQNLRNFFILYTSNMMQQPDLTSWQRCTFQKAFQSTTVATYTCDNGTAVGRRVAIYLISGSQALYTDKLTLCEVYVDGYSYNAASLSQLMNTYVASGCEGFQMNFSTTSIVPPTYLVVQLRNTNSGTVTVIERIGNTGTAFRSMNVRALANQTYEVFVSSEVCCIGSQCLNGSALEHSKCVIGQNTPPVLVIMPLYRQYALQKTGNVVNVSTVSASSCPSINQRIMCSQSQDPKNSLVKCSNSESCQLDPGYNFTCVLDVSFSDGFNQTLKKNVYISTASFSTFTISETITCNSVTLVIENFTTKWDLAPSFIEFHLTTIGANDSQVSRVPSKTKGNISATFWVRSNSSYSVWAVPVTYWGITESLVDFNGSCMVSKNCVVGERTPVKVITTLQRQYILKTQGCCASIVDVSSEQCETPVSHNITCTSKRNEVLEVLASEKGSFCVLTPNMSLTCNYSVQLGSSIVELYSQLWEIVNVTECSFIEVPESSSQIPSAAIGGAVAGLVILAIAVTLAVIVQRRRKPLRKEKPFVKPSNVIQRDADLVGASSTVLEMDDAVYGNTIGMGIEEFERYSRNKEAIFNRFSELRSNKGHPSTVGLKNAEKNRFKNIVPYDINRVLINDGTCDYINASYINGFNQDKKYIATQGPIPGTITDFWKMVWQENVSTIIMLTDYVEQSKKKCDRYFPRTGSDTGGLTVTVKTESTFDAHCLSVLCLSYEGITRIVRHCHFLAWPDKSVPEHCSHLLLFYARTREVLPSNTSNQRAPVVVHCSAGVGRTGAFIALDYLLSRFFSERRVDVDSSVMQLRDQRMNMVQTKEQYLFLHKALLYSIKTFEFIRNFTDFQQRSTSVGNQFENGISNEFQILQRSFDETSDDYVYVAARSKERVYENGNPEITASKTVKAGECNRPYLGTPTGTHEGYLNAVYCNGCYARNSFIATQWPLKDTVAKFWELVYDRNPTCIVLLHQSPSVEEYPEFYPQSGQSLTAGSFIITSKSLRENAINNGKEYDLLVKLLSGNDSVQEKSCSLRLLECRVFNLDNETPTDLQQTVSLIMSLQLVCKQSKDRPIIVVCKDGAKFCGMFIAATNSLHRLLESNQVHVFHTVDLLKESRPQFVSSLKQYRCLYQLMSCATEASAVYANLLSSSEK